MHRLPTQAVFVVAVLLLAAPAGAQNLLVNPGGEIGTMAGWSTGGSPSGQPVLDPWTHLPTPRNHTGDHRFGISVGYSVADCYQYQKVTVIPGATYRVSLWYAKEDGTDESLTVSWCNGNFGAPENTLYHVGDSTRSPDWTQLSGQTFVPNEPSATLVIHYRHQHPSGIASIHIDDIVFELVSVPPTATPTHTSTPTRTPTPTNTVGADLDGDGLADAIEGWPPALGQSHRLLADSDGDGLSDGVEDANGNGLQDAGETSTRRRDSDGDGASDGMEVLLLQTDPLDPGSPASWSDPDGDGLPVGYDTAHANPDTDGDRYTDGYEVDHLGLGADQAAFLRPELGDLNRDTAVSNLDALLAQSLFLHTTPPTDAVFQGTGFSNADGNLDGFISNVDALLVQSFFLQTVPWMPWNPPTPTPPATSTPTNTPTLSAPLPTSLVNTDFEAGFSGGVANGWKAFRARDGGFFKPNERLGRLGGGLYGCYTGHPDPDYDCLDEYESVRMSAKTYSIDASRYDLLRLFPEKLGPEVLTVGKVGPETVPHIFPDGDLWENNAEADGRRFADYLYTNWILANQGFEADAYHCINEPSMNVASDLAKVCKFELGFTHRMHELGYRTIVLNHSVGTPNPLENMLIPEVRELLAVADFVGYHAYGIWGPGWMCPPEADPWTYRWQTVSQWYQERGWRHPPVIYTEAGQYWWANDPDKTPQDILNDLVCYEARERQEEFWSVGIQYFVTGAWPGGWDEMHLALYPEIIDGCRATNLAHPVDARSGLYAQELGGRLAPFDLGLVQAIETEPGRDYALSAWFKYEYEEHWPNQAEIYVGWDWTGQTANPDAATVAWSADLIASGPNNPIYDGPWDTDIWYRYTDVLAAPGGIGSLWIRFSQPNGHASSRLYVDDVTLVKQ